MIGKKIRQGFSEYYVIEKKTSIDYEEKILGSNQIEGLLPCEIRSEEGEEFFYYQLSSFQSLEDEIKNLKFTDFLISVIQAMEELENYLLNLDHVILTASAIYLKDGKPKLCYCLEQNCNIKKQWISFVEEAVEIISYEDREQVTKIYEFHTFLTEENPTLAQMKTFLQPEEMMEMQPEMVGLDELEPWVEETFHPPKKKTKANWWLIPGILFVLIIGCLSYYIVKIYMQGWLYENIRNAAICFFCMCVDVMYILSIFVRDKKDASNASTNQKIDEYETTLLSGETQLLHPTSYPKLVPENPLYSNVRISKNVFILGSDEEKVDFQVAQIGVSRMHLKIERLENKYWIFDLGSTNGTYVNDERISQHGRVLKSEDVIRIGLEEFRYVI